MMRATDMAHAALKAAVRPGDWTVDATAGNGHDTLFLAGLVGPTGRVWGFDVQASAIAKTTARLADHAADHAPATLVEAGHEQLAAHLPAEARGRIAAVTFNLGYLPGAAHDITTHPASTLAALDQALALLAPGGVVTLVLYTGHPGGRAEADAVLAYARRLPTELRAAHFARLNARNPAPELVVIERPAPGRTPGR